MDAITYREAKLSDEILRLLTECDLPVGDLHSVHAQFITASSSTLIGCIAIEKHADDGLLRSFAVTKNFRGLGVGDKLLAKLLEWCSQNSIAKLHLLTNTAESYFKSKGFITVNRDEAPTDIKRTAEFSSICPASAAYMALNLNP